MATRQFWVMKTEPTSFSIDDLRQAKNQTTSWDGVRNYQARNFLRNQIKLGDGVLFYHSNVTPSGIVGEAVVTREGYPDPTAFDRKADHFDPKSDPQKPTWYMVDVKFVRASKQLISLRQLEKISGLSKMVLLRRGSRLSVQPVTPREWEIIMNLPEWQAPAKSST